MTEPNLDPSWVWGLDVSHYQGTVDWNSVAQRGFRFAFIKATDGISTDPELSANWPGAKAAGLIRGAYHYYDPGSDPAGWKNWRFWQFSQTGRVPGISGDVDLDVFQGNLLDLQQMASSLSMPWLSVGGG